MVKKKIDFFGKKQIRRTRACIGLKHLVGQKKFFFCIFFWTRARVRMRARTRECACARAQAFIGRKLDRSSSISYQIIILEIFFHGRKDGMPEGMPEGQDTP